MKKPFFTLAALAVVHTLSGSALAAGLYFSDRGVRPLSRAGAFVAGADDLGAISYNPAGLAFAGHQFLLDASWLQYSSTYQRKQVVADSAGNETILTHPAVEGTSPILPIPTLAYANPLGLEDFNFAIAVSAPYTAITSYPESVAGQPAPQRYSLISLDGSAMAIPGIYASWQPAESLAFGVGIEMLTGYFQTSVAMSACVPDRFLCAPEQPSWDAYSRLRVGPIFAPSGILGAIVQAHDMVKLGASLHLPKYIDSRATVDVRLPEAAVFDGASQKGNEADVNFTLPWVMRLGAELRPLEKTRVEAGFALEGWSQHEAIEIVPDNIALQNVIAFPQEYKVAPMRIERGFQDAWSVRLGGEQSFEAGGYPMDFRAGVMYEKSAIPTEYLSVTTVDLDKVTVALGGSLHIGKWRFDAVLARVFGMPTEVDPRTAAITQLNPVIANPPARPVRINGGTYQANANVMGIGLVYQFDAAEPTQAPTE